MNIADIACGAHHCLAVDESKQVLYSWGSGLNGRLGHGDETGENLPKEVSFFRQTAIKIALIEAGEANSAVITHGKGELFLWGCGMHGRLGTGKTNNVLRPSVIQDLNNLKVEDVSLGSSHTLCLLKSGQVLCWGPSTHGKMGLETALDRNFLTPKELITLDREKAFQISAGPFHSLVLTEKGKLYTFGNAKDGKLGLGDDSQTTSNVMVPRKVQEGPTFQNRWGSQD